MTQEDSINDIIESANIHLSRAENYKESGCSESAMNELASAVECLAKAGSYIISEIPKEDIIRLDGTAANVLRRLAEESELLPGNFSQTVFAVPNAKEILGAEVSEISEGSLSAEKIAGTVKNVYEKNGSESTDAESDLSSLKILTDLIFGNRKIAETIFSENGVYDIFVSSSVPYFITGAAFISRDEEKLAEYEKIIPEALNGPIRHLSKLLISLLTSAFMSGLLLLIIKRILAGRGNLKFGVSVAALTISNLPVIIEGVKAVSEELTNLKNIVFEKS